MKTLFNLRNTKPLLVILSVSALFAVCLSSCKKDNNSAVGVTAYVMAVNSAQASSPQDFYVDNNKLNESAIAYTQNTEYLAVNGGSHNVQFKTSGTTTVNGTSSASFMPGTYNSIYFTDDGSATTTQDDRTQPQSGKARVRFINVSSAVTGNVDFGLSTGNKIVTGLANKAASTYYEVDAATSFSLYASGSATAMLSIPTTIQAGHIYTIYISGATTATLTYHIIAQS
ncbi:MAG: DUF4397 domain-containing protein [Mucilaginibacter sp.]